MFVEAASREQLLIGASNYAQRTACSEKVTIAVRVDSHS